MIKTYLSKLLATGNIPNSFLFVGTYTAMQSLLEEFVNKLLGQATLHNPDLYQFYPEGKLGLHTMESLRTLKEEIYLSPYQAKCKAFIVHEADRMAVTSANALLKSLEEPLETSFIFLLSVYPERILPTIRSRCQTVYFKSEQEEQKELTMLLPALLKNLSSLPMPVLSEQLQALANQIEKMSEVSLDPVEEMTAAHKLAQEKEREGKEAIQEGTLVTSLFKSILGWYRDIELLRLNGDTRHLMHKTALIELKERVERGVYPPLDSIVQGIDQAKQAYERSTPLKNVLESLFTQLKYVERGERLF